MCPALQGRLLTGKSLEMFLTIALGVVRPHLLGREPGAATQHLTLLTP